MKHSKKLFSVLALFVALLMPMSSHAAMFGAAEEYSLRAGETLEENAYLAGGVVTVESDALADVIAAGGDVVLSGVIEEDLLVAGGSVTITGEVKGDVRVAGGEVSISGQVAGEVVGAGGYIHLTSSSLVASDVTLAGGRLLLEGEVSGDLEMYGGEIGIDGVVRGNVTSDSELLTIGENTQIDGTLTYSALDEVVPEEGAQLKGEVTYLEYTGENQYQEYGPAFDVLLGFLSALWVVFALMTFVTAVVLYHLMKKDVTRLVEHSVKNFWQEALRGFVVAIVLPIAIVIAFMTFLGAGLGMLGALVGLTVLFLADVGAGILAGTLVFKLFTKKVEVSWLTILVGVLLLQVLNFVPVIGWIIGYIFTFAASGVLWMMLYKRFLKK